jgi:hypothetical protein
VNPDDLGSNHVRPCPPKALRHSMISVASRDARSRFARDSSNSCYITIYSVHGKRHWDEILRLAVVGKRRQ